MSNVVQLKPRQIREKKKLNEPGLKNKVTGIFDDIKEDRIRPIFAFAVLVAVAIILSLFAM
jgi:hypothetical protein